MSGYLEPTSALVSDNWAGHKSRNPPSSEPGTDYACAYGTALVAPAAGRITDAKSSNGAATGRYLTLSLDDGRTVRWLHLSAYIVGREERFARGQVLAYSGASANGSDWGVGAHVHVTLWPGAIWGAPTIDFEDYIGEDEPEPDPPAEEDEEDEMAMRGCNYVRSSDGAFVRLLFNETSGWWHEFLSNDGDYVNPIATSWETNPWPTITESHARVIKTALDRIVFEPHELEAATTTELEGRSSILAGPAWLVAGVLVLIGIVNVVQLFVNVLAP